jgi:CheY-like chemotaxis protein/anti-sigma regulatory factor (Ser/Thr protein kinase)
LDLSKFDAGFSENNPESFQLSSLITRLQNTFQPIAEGKNISFNIDYSHVMIEGDIFLLQQLLGNLISNAIDYTMHGNVSVRFTTINNQLHISIQDTGCGIEASQIHKIFDEFFRVDQTRNMHDGLGLGLSIVKRLCAIIGAEISVHSEVGVGTKFDIQTRYPIAEPIGSGIEINQALIPGHQHDPSFQRKVIAIFEDDPTIYQAYTKLLTQQGCKVLALSENLEELTEQLETIDRIDCILSDFRLKSTTGDQIIALLRDSFGVDIPAIIVTADTSPAHIQLFNELNITVLYKPIGYDEIVNQIKLIAS